MRVLVLVCGLLLLASILALSPPAAAVCAVQSGTTEAGCAYAPDGDCAAGVKGATPLYTEGIPFVSDGLHLLTSHVGFACSDGVEGTGACAFGVRGLLVVFVGLAPGNWACVGVMPANGCAAGVQPHPNAQWTYVAC